MVTNKYNPKTGKMTIYFLIKPQDYQSADVEVFTTINDAQRRLEQGKLDKEMNSDYWAIRKEQIYG